MAASGQERTSTENAFLGTKASVFHTAVWSIFTLSKQIECKQMGYIEERRELGDSDHYWNETDTIFLSLLAFLLLLLIIALQRLKNIISSSSSYPEYPSDAGSSFTNLEVCSISSQRSTFSNLSSWRKWKNLSVPWPLKFSLRGSITGSRHFRKEMPMLFFFTN